MRWYKKPKPNIGDIKIENTFLFIPLTLDGETRWLEYTEIVYCYISKRTSPFDTIEFWGAIHWANSKEHIKFQKKKAAYEAYIKDLSPHSLVKKVLELRCKHTNSSADANSQS